MDTDKLELDVMRAAEADRLNTSPVLQEAHDLIEADIIAKIKTVPARDKQGRDELITLLQLNERYRHALVRVIESGKIAQERLSWLKRMQRRFAA